MRQIPRVSKIGSYIILEDKRIEQFQTHSITADIRIHHIVVSVDTKI
jgi:hypothetical protein